MTDLVTEQQSKKDESPALKETAKRKHDTAKTAAPPQPGLATGAQVPAKVITLNFKKA